MIFLHSLKSRVWRDVSVAKEARPVSVISLQSFKIRVCSDVSVDKEARPVSVIL